jgi:F-type H+-transporting ATPase subunit gamma
MPNLKEVRNRITSVSSTQQITKAMKMVSAAKLRRAQDAITQMRPYANGLRRVLENVSSSLDSSEGVFSQEREVKTVLIILVTSNRGLCGGFNASAIKRSLQLIRSEYAGKKTLVMCIGKKGNDFFKKFEEHVYGNELPHANKLSELFNHLSFDKVVPVAEAIMNAYKEGVFDKAVMVYNHFKNAAIQEIIVEQYLPVQPAGDSTNAKNDYIYEPSKEFIITELIPKSLKTQLYKALLDSNASEHGARMTAMHKATDNAGALIKELKLTYNKARQAAITKEILEIVGGAEALNG